MKNGKITIELTQAQYSILREVLYTVQGAMRQDTSEIPSVWRDNENFVWECSNRDWNTFNRMVDNI